MADISVHHRLVRTPASSSRASKAAEASDPLAPQDQVWLSSPARALPPGSYDASTISKVQLAALKKSKNPQERALGETIERARKNYADLMQSGSQVIANRNEGNGGSPVLTILPPGFDPKQETRVHTHYHGFHSTVADPKGHAARTTEQIAELQKKQPQTVVVLPETSNAQDGNYSTQWTNVKNQAETTNQALRDAGVTNPAYRVVSGHSAGGEALRKSIVNVPEGKGLQADRLELLDSLYGSQDAISDWSRTPNGRDLKSLVYVHGTNNTNNDAGLRKAFGNRYLRVEAKGHNEANHQMDSFAD